MVLQKMFSEKLKLINLNIIRLNSFVFVIDNCCNETMFCNKQPIIKSYFAC